MRGFSVDERDSTWERDDARYRLYVFQGPGNAVTATDIVEATIEEALESALTLSNRDEHLWSLALVENDARGMRGLIWLSGMDYNDTPTTGREWQRRKQMQDRYLMAKSRRGEPAVLPNGLRLVRVFPEWVSGWPLWENFTDAYRHTGPDLGLTRELSDALFDWNEAWLARQEDDPRPAGWEDEGHRLVGRLRSELAGIAEVRPEFLR
ncbi:hypothetical protein [Microbacterium wangchenii]|uniref:hypothetical protein n=1 Tax=Microbacterium wangchenii TaxID=2541726 RepID=UPI0011CC64D9|nr:hypothetical protein [Microbacterium wangchenii]TXK14798.1 hypothetical protein FVP99_14020 [Microbacterium wangchenii]